MGSKAIHQFQQVTDEDDSDVLGLIRSDGSGGYLDRSISRRLIGYMIRSEDQTYTSAQVLALNGTPQLLVSGVAGKIIMPIGIAVSMTGATINYATNTTLTVGSASVISDTNYTMIGGFPLLVAPQVVLFPVLSASSTITTAMLSGDDLYLRAKTGNPTAGDGSFTVQVLYYLADEI